MEVNIDQIRNVFVKYMSKKISENELINWESFVLFSDYYYFNEKQRTIIAEVLHLIDQIEDLSKDNIELKDKHLNQIKRLLNTDDE